MGYNHATSGLLVGVATVQMLPVDHWTQQMAWVVGLGGASMLPDLDTSGSHPARMWGAPTRMLGSAVGAIAQGHRMGTHDVVLAPLILGGATWLAALHPVGLGAVLALCIGLALRGLMVVGVGRIGAPINIVLSGVGAWWLVSNGASGLELLPVVVALGVLVHILGDLITTEGVPIPVLWLFGVRRRVTLNLFRVNSGLERYLIAPLLSLATLGLLASHLGIHDLPSLLDIGDRVARVVATGGAAPSVSSHV